MKKLEKILYKKVSLWIVILLIIFGLIFIILFGAALKHEISKEDQSRLGSFGPLLVNIATIPSNLKNIFYGFASMGLKSIQPQILQTNNTPGFLNHDLSFVDNGYLLLSAYDHTNKVSTIFLYDLESQAFVHNWIPDVDKVNKITSFQNSLNIKSNYRSQHPLLTDDGGIITGSGEGPLIKLDFCSNLEWAIDRHFHHSIEYSYDFKSIFAPIVIDDFIYKDNLPIKLKIRNDGFALVLENGEIKKEWSVAQILLDNGYQGLLYGVNKYIEDRIHLNDVEEIKETDSFVKKGDLMISSRHLSTVFLYRPSLNKIVWLKTGPYLNQHDVDYLGGGKFSIFGNDNVNSINARAVSKYNSIWIYDMKTDKTYRYLELSDLKLAINSQGAHKILKNGDVFIDDGTSVLRVSKSSNLRWSYRHPVGEKAIGALHWSRYLEKSEVLNFLNLLKKEREC